MANSKDEKDNLKDKSTGGTKKLVLIQANTYAVKGYNFIKGIPLEVDTKTAKYLLQMKFKEKIPTGIKEYSVFEEVE